MEFKDLPFEIQLVAADTLKNLLLDTRPEDEEPAVKLAHVVKSAFVKLMND